MPITQKTIDAGRLTLSYVECGGGDPLVFLHGLSGRWQAWSQEIALLAHRWRVFAVDARGHGESSPAPDGRYDFRALTEDAVAFLEGAVQGAAVLVGHSLGAVTAAGVAGERPDLVRAVVLEDPPFYIPAFLDKTGFHERFVASRERGRAGMAAEDIAEALLEADPAADAAGARATAASHSRMDAEAWTPQIEMTSLDTFDSDAILAKIECPVLLLQADPDLGAALLPGEEKRVVSLVRDCTLVQFSGVGHGIHRGDPIAFRRVLFDFLDTV